MALESLPEWAQFSRASTSRTVPAGSTAWWWDSGTTTSSAPGIAAASRSQAVIKTGAAGCPRRIVVGTLVPSIAGVGVETEAMSCVAYTVVWARGTMAANSGPARSWSIMGWESRPLSR